jgi:hypothetical protein
MKRRGRATSTSPRVLVLPDTNLGPVECLLRLFRGLPQFRAKFRDCNDDFCGSNPQSLGPGQLKPFFTLRFNGTYPIAYARTASLALCRLPYAFRSTFCNVCTIFQ